MKFKQKKWKKTKLPKALFTKVVTNTYQYTVEVDNVENFHDNRYDQQIVDSFKPDTLVDVHWYIDVEEV